MSKIKRCTPNLRALSENVAFNTGNIEVVVSSLDTQKDDVVLFTGSILDKSEIDYRSVTNTVGKYFTVIPDDMNENEVDSYWKIQTIILTKGEAEHFLSDMQIDNFSSSLKTIEAWYAEGIEEYEKNKEEEPVFDNFSDYQPINASNYVGMDQVSGFRSSSSTEYMDIKYNSKDKKGTKALIVRLSMNSDDSPMEIINVTGINNKEDLGNFFNESKRSIRKFCRSDVNEESINFNGNAVLLEKITRKIPDEMQLIVLHKNKSGKVIFDENNIDNLEKIEDFVLLKVYKQNNNSSSIEKYRSFLENIKNYSDSQEFKNDFMRIIYKSKNAFLIRQIKHYQNKKKNLQNDELNDASFELLQNFYTYLITGKTKYANNKENDADATPSQIVAIDAVLRSVDSIDSLNDEIIYNFYFTLRNTILKNSTSFMKLFDEYNENYEYEVTNSIHDYEKNTDLKDIYEKAEEFDSPEDLVVGNSFGNQMAFTMTFIDRLLRYPSQLTQEQQKYMDIKRIWDLTIMWSVLDKINSETTRAPAQRLMQKCYLSSSKGKEKKEQWVSAVIKVIHTLFVSNYEYDSYTGLISKFDVNKFNMELDLAFDIEDQENNISFIEKTSYKFPEDFLDIKSVTNKFNNYYEWTEAEGTVERYMISLFIPIIYEDFTKTLEQSKLLTAGIEDDYKIDIDALSAITDVIKPIVCKKKYIDSSEAEMVCNSFFVKIAFGEIS